VTARDVLDGIRVRAKAYTDHGTPGLAAPRDRIGLLAAVEAALALAEKFEASQSSDIAKRQDMQFDLGYSAGSRAAGSILRAAIENALEGR
jgi:hypothetical protein